MRKSSIVSIALITVAFVYILYTSGAEDVRYPTKGTTIVAFGDSLVEGVGATEGNDFVSILSARVGEPIVNMGVSGDTTADGLARLDTVLAQDPRIVILVLGGNDALRQTPPEETFSNIRACVEKLQARGTAVLLVAEPGGITYTSTYEREYERISEEYGLLLVPNILHGLLGKREYMSDTIHPNDAGYVRVADKIEPSLRKLMMQ